VTTGGTSKTPSSRSSGGERVVYGRSDRPAMEVAVAGEWVVCEVLGRATDADGTWWAWIRYIHPDTYWFAEETLPLDGLRPFTLPPGAPRLRVNPG
jgi:hypothetical protein